jgi:hypothetical protein
MSFALELRACFNEANAPAYCNAHATSIAARCCIAKENDVSSQACVKSMTYAVFSLEKVKLSASPPSRRCVTFETIETIK